MSMRTGPRWLGKYELREVMGQGGSAEVWRAWDSQLQRAVAIKMLHADGQAEFLRRFEREARMVASLHHPNIVQVHDFQVVNGLKPGHFISYMVMEYVEGPNLAQYIAHTSAKRQFPTPLQVVQLFASLGSAIDYAHQHKVIHRDIKPANILLDAHTTTHNGMGEPILTDFGIARLRDISTGMMSAGWQGTEWYMSPEQVQGYPGDERSDIYSLGVVLYEVCTGAQPFRGGTPNQMPVSPATFNPALPPAVMQVMLRCLAKEPEMRFANASSLVAALAQSFHVPAPETLRLFDSPASAPNDETLRLSPGMLPHGSQHLFTMPTQQATPQSFPLPHPSAEGESFVATWPMTPTPFTPPVSGVVTPTSEPGTWVFEQEGYPGRYPASNMTPLPPVISPEATPALPSTPILRVRGRPRWLSLALIALIFLLVVGGSLGAFYFLNKSSQPPVAVASNPIVGHAFFVSSGRLQATSNQGMNDEVQINLSNIPDPSPGKSYFAWLLKDKSETDTTALLLGKLDVSSGSVHFLYTGDAQHDNLLSQMSRVLITEEDAAMTPMNPSPDHSTWRYYAELPQTPDPKDSAHHFSMLDHLRALLAEDPYIAQYGLHGGLNTWLVRNTEKLLEWSGSARDYWGEANSTTLMRNQFIRILDYLDGAANVQTDVPPRTPVLVSAPVAMLGITTPGLQNPGESDYVHAIIGHLNAIAAAPGVSASTLARASQINSGLNNLANWLQSVRLDAKHLLAMSTAQLLLPSTLPLLDDLQINAYYAYVGRLDPATNQQQPGATQISYNIERLATFDMQAYKAT